MNKWERYERTAEEVLGRLTEHFNLKEVTGKEKIPGDSGTDWEIDVLATSSLSEKRVLIECRLTKARQSQAKIGEFALRLLDTGAERGIIITPNPLQKGAALVAKKYNITHFKLSSQSTPNNFLAESLGKLFLGTPSVDDISAFGTPSIGAVPSTREQATHQRFNGSCDHE